MASDKTITTPERTEAQLAAVSDLIDAILDKCIRPIGGTQIDADVALMADLIDQYANQRR